MGRYNYRATKRTNEDAKKKNGFGKLTAVCFLSPLWGGLMAIFVESDSAVYEFLLNVVTSCFLMSPVFAILYLVATRKERAAKRAAKREIKNAKRALKQLERAEVRRIATEKREQQRKEREEKCEERRKEREEKREQQRKKLEAYNSPEKKAERAAEYEKAKAEMKRVFEAERERKEAKKKRKEDDRRAVSAVLITTNNKKSGVGAVGRAVVGGALLGPVGAVAGAVSGTSKATTATFSVKYASGRTGAETVTIGSARFNELSALLHK